MNIYTEYCDREGIVHKNYVRSGYLQKFIKANKKYPVSYVYSNSGERIEQEAMVLGKDLTEGQIVDLFTKQRI